MSNQYNEINLEQSYFRAVGSYEIIFNETLREKTIARLELNSHLSARQILDAIDIIRRKYAFTMADLEFKGQ